MKEAHCPLFQHVLCHEKKTFSCFRLCISSDRINEAYTRFAEQFLLRLANCVTSYVEDAGRDMGRDVFELCPIPSSLRAISVGRSSGKASAKNGPFSLITPFIFFYLHFTEL